MSIEVANLISTNGPIVLNTTFNQKLVYFNIPKLLYAVLILQETHNSWEINEDRAVLVL